MPLTASERAATVLRMLFMFAEGGCAEGSWQGGFVDRQTAEQRGGVDSPRGCGSFKDTHEYRGDDVDPRKTNVAHGRIYGSRTGDWAGWTGRKPSESPRPWTPRSTAADDHLIASLYMKRVGTVTSSNEQMRSMEESRRPRARCRARDGLCWWGILYNQQWRTPGSPN